MRTSPNRSGLTLLEVLISLAIFLSSLTGIMQLLAIGQRAELQARLQAEAVIRCESKMAEVIAGIEELKSGAGQPFLDEGNEEGFWQWKLEVADAGTTGLLQVTVIVDHQLSEDQINAGFTLTRYMRDPQIFIDAALSETSE
ncbi:MAG: prepilin-type N-terminal cleavage/methylation domain-containing protein [Planctomyces sp.]|nr:prepilin-type N-terminal cleavage/methylation domain-containing protein [Planctomyces sp.]